jgi:hypothetical protein
MCPDCIQLEGSSLIGRNIKVWWTDDQAFYKGHINYFDEISGLHRILYDDGQWEFLRISAEPFVFLTNRIKKNDCILEQSLPISTPNNNKSIQNSSISIEKSEGKSVRSSSLKSTEKIIKKSFPNKIVNNTPVVPMKRIQKKVLSDDVYDDDDFESPVKLRHSTRKVGTPNLSNSNKNYSISKRISSRRR